VWQSVKIGVAIGVARCGHLQLTSFITSTDANLLLAPVDVMELVSWSLDRFDRCK